MKIWITKYALTKGIVETEGKPSENTPSMVCTRGNGYFHGVDWHRSLAEAQTQAEDMRKRKIESMRRHMRSLESKKIKVIKW